MSVPSRTLAHRPLKVIRPPSLSLSMVVSGIRNLVRYSHLLYTFTSVRLNVRYKQSALGWIWAMLQPLALLISYTLIFSRVAKLPSEGTPYPLFVLAALLPWGLFASSIANATTGIVNQYYLVMKIYFPREIITLSYISAAVVDFGIAAVLSAGFMVYYGIKLTWNVLYVVPILVILAVFSTAVALLLSALQVRWRDIGMAMPLLLQVWMFATPVVYPLQSVPVAVQRIYMLNPVAVLVDAFRRVTVHGQSPDFALLGLAASITFVSLLASYAVFKHMEATMADFI